jgi:curli production assembly/transport component CsgF
MKFLFILAIFLCGLQVVSGQDFVYKQESLFGGDTFNYQWLASSAESQNKFKDKINTSPAQTELKDLLQV